MFCGKLAVVDADLNAALRGHGYDWERIRAGVGDFMTRALR